MIKVIKHSNGTEERIWVEDIPTEPVEPIVTPIRYITTNAMLRRFTLNEEVAIEDGTDTMAKVIRNRLLSAPFIDLEFEDLKYGIAYVTNYLSNIGKLYGGDAVKRSEELLKAGESYEEYKRGVY